VRVQHTRHATFAARRCPSARATHPAEAGWHAGAGATPLTNYTSVPCEIRANSGLFLRRLSKGWVASSTSQAGAGIPRLRLATIEVRL